MSETMRKRARPNSTSHSFVIVTPPPDNTDGATGPYVMCSGCLKRAALNRVRKQGENFGRHFWGCPLYGQPGVTSDACKAAFKWADETDEFNKDNFEGVSDETDQKYLKTIQALHEEIASLKNEVDQLTTQRDTFKTQNEYLRTKVTQLKTELSAALKQVPLPSAPPQPTNLLISLATNRPPSPQCKDKPTTAPCTGVHQFVWNSRWRVNVCEQCNTIDEAYPSRPSNDSSSGSNLEDSTIIEDDEEGNSP